MPILRSMRLFNAIEGSQYTSATLETLLADQGRRNDLDALAADRALMRRLAETPAAAAVILGSARGRASLFASTIAMEAFCGARLGRDSLFNTPAVATALAASAVGMATVGDSVVCKMALSDSATALAAVLASTTAINTLRAAARYEVFQLPTPGAVSQQVAFSLPGERYIVLGGSCSSSQNLTVTLRAMVASGNGSSILAIVTSDPAGSTATAKPAAFSIRAPYTQQSSQNMGMFLGLLRCDI